MGGTWIIETSKIVNNVFSLEISRLTWSSYDKSDKVFLFLSRLRVLSILEEKNFFQKWYVNKYIAIKKNNLWKGR